MVLVDELLLCSVLGQQVNQDKLVPLVLFYHQSPDLLDFLILVIQNEHIEFLPTPTYSDHAGLSLDLDHLHLSANQILPFLDPDKRQLILQLVQDFSYLLIEFVSFAGNVGRLLFLQRFFILESESVARLNSDLVFLRFSLFGDLVRQMR